MVNDQQYDVYVYCGEKSFNNFPFGIETRFNKKLSYDINKNSMSFGYINLRYKLGSGTKKDYQKLSTLDIVNQNMTGISSEKLNNFSLGHSSTPLNLNLKERKESMSNGEINILIPIGLSGTETYSLKFNPFHKSWSDYHKLKCGVKDSGQPV